jgi:hypothetical protein
MSCRQPCQCSSCCHQRLNGSLPILEGMEMNDVGEVFVPIDPVCILHGKKKSEHVCLFCCICFCDLTPETCHTLEDGTKEDICEACALSETVTDSGEL